MGNNEDEELSEVRDYMERLRDVTPEDILSCLNDFKKFLYKCIGEKGMEEAYKLRKSLTHRHPYQPIQ